MLRVILGILKGGIVGAAIGYGAFRLGLGGGILAFAAYAAIGFVVGIVCGKAPWKQETIWTPVIKGIFGALIAAGLAWVGRKFLGGMSVPLPADLGITAGTPLVQVPFLLGPAIGILYGVFVEIDDGGKSDEPAKKLTASN